MIRNVYNSRTCFTFCLFPRVSFSRVDQNHKKWTFLRGKNHHHVNGDDSFNLSRFSFLFFTAIMTSDGNDWQSLITIIIVIVPIIVYKDAISFLSFVIHLIFSLFFRFRMHNNFFFFLFCPLSLSLLFSLSFHLLNLIHVHNFSRALL